MCTIGKCNRLATKERIDIEFDLFFDGKPCKGFVECKYVDANVGKSTVIDYIIRSNSYNSPFSMLVTYSMQKSLKSAELWKNLAKSSEYVALDHATVREATFTKPTRKKPKVRQISVEERKEIENDEKEKLEKSLEKEEEEEEALKKKEKEEEISKIMEGISIYSVFYENRQLIAVPLVEFENPKSVFVIIETNFTVPKI